MKKIYTIIFFIFTLTSLFAQQSEQELIQEGVELHDKGEYKKAIEKYEQALEANPQSISAIYEMSLSYLELKDFRNASKYSSQVTNSNDKGLSVGAYCVKSEALAGMGKIDEAIKALKEGIIKNGNDYLLHFNMALHYYSKGDLANTVDQVKTAIDLSKSYAGAYLLYSYALNDMGAWVQSILAMQMFLLLEPDSNRSKNAFDEMLQVMRIKPRPQEPIERSFIQQQLNRNTTKKVNPVDDKPLLNTVEGLDRQLVYNSITTTLDSLKENKKDSDMFLVFKSVNNAILTVLEDQSKVVKENNILWTFYVPFFTAIHQSNYFETYSRYISVSYFPESLEWWNNNETEAGEFLSWFEHGENNNEK